MGTKELKKYARYYLRKQGKNGECKAGKLGLERFIEFLPIKVRYCARKFIISFNLHNSGTYAILQVRK